MFDGLSPIILYLGTVEGEQEMDWVNFVFPMMYLSSDEEEESNQCMNADLYEDCMSDAYTLCEVNELLGNALRPALLVLSQNVRQCNFEFCSMWESMKLFLSEEDYTHFLDCFFLEAIAGSYSVFREEFNQYLKHWAEQSKNYKEISISLSGGKKRDMKARPNIPKEEKRILSKWFEEHVSYPYPKVREKERLSYQTGLSIKKVENWFINERSRKWHLYRKKF